MNRVSDLKAGIGMNTVSEIGEELNEMDMQILSLLQANALTGYEAIGTQVGLSESAVRYRIRKLQDIGVILGFTCAVDLSKLGYRLLIFAGIDVAAGKEKVVAGKIGKFPNVIGVFTVSNTYDMVTLMMLRNKDELAEIVEKIRAVKEVDRVDCILTLKTHKWDCVMKIPVAEEGKGTEGTKETENQ